MVQVAFLGLGNMGEGMISNIVTKGNLDSPLIIWNRSTSKAEQFAAGKNITVASSIEDAVTKSDIIFSCVSNDEAITSVYDVALKVQGGVHGKVFSECSTIHPDTTRQLEKVTKEAGAEFVASPVFGAPAAAAAGVLVFVLAGSKAGIEKIQPYLTGVMGRQFIDLSEDPDVGKALTLKIAGNTIILGMVEALSEGHVLAEKTGLGTENFEKFIAGLFGQSPYLPYSKRLTSGDYVREHPLFAVDLAAKDARHALSLAKSSGTTLPVTEIAAKNLAAVKEKMGENGDITSIYGILREGAGLPFIEKK
ncbi:NAD binding domain of 6-phosphogluconate dehydrogenase-domain-containing protein [Lipomyces kononenkoae]|uniref:NAD binding domain of 6-phosphogluconate dehydrogenase-domain-containing protein n=1 Tax=Lipomyces kononenkoae TaxID=34357 RepID=A0ACC3T866_LIPKO